MELMTVTMELMTVTMELVVLSCVDRWGLTQSFLFGVTCSVVLVQTRLRLVVKYS